MSDNVKSDPTNEAIRLMCQLKFGALDSEFLCQSLSALNPQTPLCVEKGILVKKALEILRENSIGCLLVTNKDGTVAGIFSERDVLLKVTLRFNEIDTLIIDDVMTADPVSQPPDSTVAYALNLMSHGGFRHLPIVDQTNHPIGIISVKNVVDHLVDGFMDDVLSFPLPEME